MPTEKVHGLQIMKMCESFAVTDINVELVVPNRSNKRFNEINPYEYYTVKQNFIIKKIKSLDPVFLIRLKNGFYIKIQALFFYFSLFFHLFFKRNSKDYILYCRDSYLLPLLLFFSKKVIWECHDLPNNKKYYVKYWKKCHRIITITNGLKKALINLDIDNGKILTSPDAVELERFSNIKESKEEIRKKLNFPLDKNIIIYSGHLYKWKGTQVLADASRFLTNKELIVFVGGMEEDIINFKKANKQYNNILIVGHEPYDKIPLYLKSADLLILPNSAESDISRLYTSPLKLFEYMASGRPIISSNLPSLREILNENNAILVKPDSSEDLANGINRALKNRDFSDKISSQAYQDVQKYTWQKRANNILKFIK